MRLPIFLLAVFLIKVFSLKMFLGKSPIKCLSKNHYKWFFRLSKVFSKFYQTPNFFSKTLFRLKTLPIIIVKQTLILLALALIPIFHFLLLFAVGDFTVKETFSMKGGKNLGLNCSWRRPWLEVRLWVTRFCGSMLRVGKWLHSLILTLEENIHWWLVQPSGGDSD